MAIILTQLMCSEDAILKPEIPSKFAHSQKREEIMTRTIVNGDAGFCIVAQNH
jgi:hypothetical protein